MKTIVEINSNNYASMGNIMLNIAKCAREKEYKVYTCCKKSKKSLSFYFQDQLYIGNRIERIISERLAYITGLNGHFNIIGTLCFIKMLKKIKPDLIHIHSLVDTYINLKMFFKYIAEENIPVVFTAHDVWPITGRCVGFNTGRNCDLWKKGCGNCPLLHNYPKSLIFDTSRLLLKEKKKMFVEVKDLYIVSPSRWLHNLISESSLESKNNSVINNGIDLSLFKPLNSSFRKDYNLIDKYIILGVSYGWSYEKGLDSFIELSKRLSQNYRIVLVGTSEETDAILPSNITSIHKTYNVEELIKIYSCANVFVNVTLSDNFPTVNLEALACGTPVITYNTGGSPEAIDESCGFVVEKNDIDDLVDKITTTCENNLFSKENCIKRSKLFNADDKYQEYVELFNKILNV